MTAASDWLVTGCTVKVTLGFPMYQKCSPNTIIFLTQHVYIHIHNIIQNIQKKPDEEPEVNLIYTYRLYFRI